MNTPRKPIGIPVVAAAAVDPLAGACASGEPYALMVLGDSMRPEFEEGWIIVVEPGGEIRDGAFVIAYLKDAEREDERYILRQLVKHPEGWMLKPLNPLYPNIPIERVEDVVKGVVVLKRHPSRRSEQKRYG